MTDEEVIARSLDEPELFGLLFNRHFDMIGRFCVRRIGAIAGEDLAGDVFRWAFENRRSFDPERGAVRSWLYRIAYNQIRHAWRSSDRRDLAYVRWSTREDRETADPAAETADVIDAEHDLRAVIAVLELQPFEDVETLLLFAWEELSYAEISEVLAIPIGTVRSRINRVRHHLCNTLDDSFVQPVCPSQPLGGLQ